MSHRSVFTTGTYMYKCKNNSKAPTRDVPAEYFCQSSSIHLSSEQYFSYIYIYTVYESTWPDQCRTDLLSTGPRWSGGSVLFPASSLSVVATVYMSDLI